MMGLLETAEVWLRSQRRSSLAKTITYRRGLVENDSILASQAETIFESDNGEMIIDSKVVDWLIDRADLTLSAIPVEPRNGDQITIALDHATLVFEVCAIGGEPAWRWHGRDGQTFRIHTKQIGTE
jgi:hypothetical protein